MSIPLYVVTSFLQFLSALLMYYACACNTHPYAIGSTEGITIRQNPVLDDKGYYPWNDGVGDGNECL